MTVLVFDTEKEGQYGPLDNVADEGRNEIVGVGRGDGCRDGIRVGVVDGIRVEFVDRIRVGVVDDAVGIRPLKLTLALELDTNNLDTLLCFC